MWWLVCQIGIKPISLVIRSSLTIDSTLPAGWLSARRSSFSEPGDSSLSCWSESWAFWLTWEPSNFEICFSKGRKEFSFSMTYVHWPLTTQGLLRSTSRRALCVDWLVATSFKVSLRATKFNPSFLSHFRVYKKIGSLWNVPSQCTYSTAMPRPTMGLRHVSLGCSLVEICSWGILCALLVHHFTDEKHI